MLGELIFAFAVFFIVLTFIGVGSNLYAIHKEIDKEIDHEPRNIEDDYTPHTRR